MATKSASVIPVSQFSPIAPLKIMTALDHARIFGNYHLLLAHIILADPSSWREYYANRRKSQQLRDFIIMDNSLIELGYALPPKDILKAAKLVGAKAIILPDALLEAEYTIAASRAAAAELGGTPPEGTGWMGVVQGKNVFEVMGCAKHLARIPGMKYLAIPRVLTNNGMSRMDLVDNIYREFRLPIHLLGFSDNLRDDMAATALSGVMGIDSAMPIWLGARKGSLERTISAKNDFGSRPSNFWELETTTIQMANNIHRVQGWIEKYVKMSSNVVVTTD